VPWQQVAQSAPSPAIAGFSLPQVSSNQFAALSPIPNNGPYTVPNTVQSEDEDAAESIRAPDENIALIHAEGSKPAVAQTAAPAVPPAADTRPAKNLAAAQAKLVNTAVNAPVNVPRPQMRPSLRDEASEGDVEATAPGRNWTIQIGAYADKALALAQLKTYAGKAQDILARASQIVAPLQSNNGHVIYRARFGLFAEQEAREVCNRLTQRGQTCFAAVQTR
jgi:D-alanyl-D-alanine carboxypeptidase